MPIKSTNFEVDEHTVTCGSLPCQINHGNPPKLSVKRNLKTVVAPQLIKPPLRKSLTKNTWKDLHKCKLDMKSKKVSLQLFRISAMFMFILYILSLAVTRASEESKTVHFIITLILFRGPFYGTTWLSALPRFFTS